MSEEVSDLYQYEVINAPRLFVCPTKGICRIIDREKVTHKHKGGIPLFRNGSEVVTVELIKSDGSSGVNFRLAASDIRFEEAFECEWCRVIEIDQDRFSYPVSEQGGICVDSHNPICLNCATEAEEDERNLKQAKESQ
jgi:hypothetical protein